MDKFLWEIEICQNFTIKVFFSEIKVPVPAKCSAQLRRVIQSHSLSLPAGHPSLLAGNSSGAPTCDANATDTDGQV